MHLTITNRSRWPTPALRIICRWIARQAGIAWDYQFYLGNRPGGWHGHGGRQKQSVHCDRHYRGKGKRQWPWAFTDRRFQWSPAYGLASRLELLVFLLAHEAVHAVSGRPQDWKEGQRTNRDGMEHHCNVRAMAMVGQFHQQWPGQLRPAIYAAMRKEKQARQALTARRLAKRRDPAPKLAKAQARLKDWQRKLKLAQGKVKKYLGRVKYYTNKLTPVSGGAHDQTIEQVNPSSFTPSSFSQRKFS